MHVNLDGMFLACKHAIPAMIRSAAGGVNVSSTAGLRLRGLAAHTVSKGAVIGLTKAIAVDHGANRIRVNCVAPGPVDKLAVYARRITEQARDIRRRVPTQPSAALTSDEAGCSERGPGLVPHGGVQPKAAIKPPKPMDLVRRDDTRQNGEARPR